jgi:hypothetical protein
MATYRIIVRDVTYKAYEIEADSVDEADEKLTLGYYDESLFPEILDGGEWEITDIYPLKEVTSG